jgi:two-component system response regulator HydG
MVGSTKSQKIDVRIIAATNSNLLDMVKEGTFREDLYYRLNVVNVEMPPLRERSEDIPILVRYFIRKYVDEFSKSKITMDEKALAILQRHSWPGNIRELENVVQRAIIMCDKVIEVKDLPDYLKLSEPITDPSTNLSKSLKEIEKEHILKVLNFVKGNKTKAAEILGIDRKTLRQKLDQ